MRKHTAQQPILLLFDPPSSTDGKIAREKASKIHVVSPSFALPPFNISGVIKILFASLSVKILD